MSEEPTPKFVTDVAMDIIDMVWALSAQMAREQTSEDEFEEKLPYLVEAVSTELRTLMAYSMLAMGREGTRYFYNMLDSELEGGGNA